MLKNTIRFGNGNRAVVLTAGHDETPDAILDALGISPPRAVILIFGGASAFDNSRQIQLATLLADGVTSVAADLGAVIIDGGTESGVMAMVGEAVAAHPGSCPLLGIAPRGKITHPEISGASVVSDGAALEPNHSHFVLVESNEWGGETSRMLELAHALKVPVAAILINGGAIAADEALESVRNGWPLLVFEGSGRFADELSSAVRGHQSARSPGITEIARSGRVTLFHIDGAPQELKNRLRRMLKHDENGSRFP